MHERPAAPEIAQLNLSWSRGPLHSRVMAGFVRRSASVDAAARRADGFCWRHPVGEGDGTAFGDPSIVVNLSTWRDLDALLAFVHHDPAHRDVLRLGDRWFTRPAAPSQVLWWVPAGHRPDLTEARARLDLLADSGPTPRAFTAAVPFGPAA